ncbi:MAG TPA: glutamine--tRNA ligase [Burkholderiaceae bacterium]|nr:glutamine--tRNA ligase [Burkholderiaceae bacterium]
MNKSGAAKAEGHATNFIRNIVEGDLERGALARRHWNGQPGDGEFQAQGPLDAAKIRTRFPPEPNGYLHIGHAKSICLNFGLARDFGGRCHLRFDDTNPVKEDQEYVDGILDAVQWLGFGWRDDNETNLYHASDYFPAFYRFAEYLIQTGHAYVDEQSAEEMRVNRGTLTEPGRDSPYRNRSVDENLRLFHEMRAGKHPEGSMILRAKIDMASPNMNLRDPALYRIRFAEHHQTGTEWPIYPMYDYAHALSDALENISHSICTLEFEDHRPLYDWCLERCVPVLRAPQWQAALELVRAIRAEGEAAQLAFARRAARFQHKLFASDAEARLRAMMNGWTDDAPPSPAELDAFFDALLGTDAEQFAPLLAHALDERKPDPFELPHQYEFSRLKLTYVVTSKRKLLQLVQDGHVDGWDDPRMPTIVGLRRRGYTPESLQLLCDRVGVSKADGWIDYTMLEQALRDDLEPKAPRAMAVLRPVKLVITNWPEGHTEECNAPVHPHRPELGRRQFPIGRELWIEREDFEETPPKGFFRLFPGNMVRLKYGYVVKCTGAVKDAQGQIIEVHAEYLPDTKSGTPGADGVKVKGNITWVSAAYAQPALIRLYDRLFLDEQPDAGGRDFLELLNPNAKVDVQGYVEPGLNVRDAATHFQFERHGYFVVDATSAHELVFNRTVTLKDSWQR